MKQWIKDFARQYLPPRDEAIKWLVKRGFAPLQAAWGARGRLQCHC
jgi:hypothetical protein